MSGITRTADGVFEVDFAALKEGRRAFWRPREPVEVDEFLLGRALAAVLARCERRDLAGRLLLWNDIRIFLSEHDFRFLEVNLPRTRRDLEALVADHARTAEAVFVQGAPPAVAVACDADAPLARGRGKVRVGWRGGPPAEAPRIAAAEATQRAGAFSAAPIQGEPTRRLPESSAGLARLRWALGEALLCPGRRYTVGRASPDNEGQPDLIRLEGVETTVSRAHLFIEVGPQVLTFQRAVGVNAVQIGDQPLTEGGRCFLDPDDLPVTVVLADGAARLEVLPGGGP
jgi:hypothetical protein